MRTNLTKKRLELLLSALAYFETSLIEDEMFDSAGYSSIEEAQKEINATYKWITRQKARRISNEHARS